MNASQIIKSSLNGVRNYCFKVLKDTGKFVGYSVFGAAGAYTFDQNVGCLRQIKGPSMIPTLNNSPFNEFTNWDHSSRQNKILWNDLVYFSRKTKTIERGDIVLFKRPRTESYIVKRVVGVQGDIVTPIKPGGAEGEPVTIKEGQLWVESDAGFGHADSSLFGPIQKECIEGIGQFVIIFDASKGFFSRLYRDLPEHVKGRILIAPEKFQETNQSKIQETSQSQIQETA